MADHRTNKRLISNIDIFTPENSPLMGENKKPRIEEMVEPESDDIDTEIDDIATEIDDVHQELEDEELSQYSMADDIYMKYVDKIEEYGLENVLIQAYRNENSLLSRIDSGCHLYEDSSDHDVSEHDGSQ